MTRGRRIVLWAFRFLLRLTPRRWRRRWSTEAEDLFLLRLETDGWLRGAVPALADAVRHVAPLPGSFRGAGLATDVWSDLRYSLRRIWKDRLFSATAILAVGVGLAGTNALFTVVDAILFAPLPVAQPERLVHLYTSTSDGKLYGLSSWGDLRHMQDAVGSLGAVAGFQRVIAKVSRDDGAPANVAFSDGTLEPPGGGGRTAAPRLGVSAGPRPGSRPGVPLLATGVRRARGCPRPDHHRARRPGSHRGRGT